MFERLPDQLLIHERAIDLGRVKESDATLDRSAQEPNRLALLGERRIRLAQPHAPQTDRRDLEALSKSALVHTHPTILLRRARPKPSRARAYLCIRNPSGGRWRG